MSTDESLQTLRTTVKRLPKRAGYDRATIEAILDEGLLCHVGFTVETQPYVLPTIYARAGAEVYVHGSAASRMLGSLESGVDACLTVTLLDGLVLARSAFHHSMNYRSVVILGRARAIEDRAQKLAALRAIVEHVVPGRWSDVRPPHEKELKATTVLSMPIDEASAKIRSGGPLDDEEDFALPVWAGVLPLELVTRPAIPDPRLPPGLPTPACVHSYRRPRRGVPR